MWGSFSPVELTHFSLLESSFGLHGRFRLCDHTVGGVLMWRCYFQTDFSLTENGDCLLRIRRNDGPAYAIVASSSGLQSALELLEKQGPFRLCAVPEETLPLLEQRYGLRMSAVADPAQSDYLYRVTDLLKLEGKKYHPQRNHMAEFSKRHPQWEYLSLNADTLCMAKDFLNASRPASLQEGSMVAEEALRACEALTYGFTPPLFGGLLAENGRVLALSIGEVQGDTLFVHVEKALREERGSYQTMAHQLLLHCPREISYVNREEDDGIEGLRRAKMAYHPCALLKKYTVEIN